jgi:glycosyltransferase involved in cell wall biosynthesis
VRIAVHTDFEYHAAGGEVRGEHAFTLFFVELAERVDGLVLLGRLDPGAGRPRYALGPRITFVALPFYESLAQVRSALGAMAGAMRAFWKVLGQVDVVWLLGPHPLQVGFIAMALLRRRRVVLGVRQDFPSLVAKRHPARRDLRLVARLLEWTWRAMSRFLPVVVVGPALARTYDGGRDLLEITASLVSRDQIVAPETAERSYRGNLQVLSVGRLDPEKNPLLLADLLADLRARDRRWRAVVVGEGPMSGELDARLEQLGVRGAAELRGYVPFGPELFALYRESHVLMHVSWTEGLPQVLLEAFAARLPVVATDVGGIGESVGEAALLVPPGDRVAAAEALHAVVGDAKLRRRLLDAGHRYVSERTLEAESERVADFLRPRQS